MILNLMKYAIIICSYPSYYVLLLITSYKAQLSDLLSPKIHLFSNQQDHQESSLGEIEAHAKTDTIGLIVCSMIVQRVLH